MTTHDKNEEQHLSHNWDPLDPKVKQAVRQSLADWLAKEYAPPAEIPPELRELLKRMDE
jgi:hypothetical protein